LAQVIRNVIDEAVLADEVGIDFFGVGEHHRLDFAKQEIAVLKIIDKLLNKGLAAQGQSARLELQ
jgi:hypothetical protein